MLRVIYVLSALFIAFCSVALAQVPSVTPINREILALYDSQYEPTPSDTMIHMNAEMPLNHLGYMLRYHDLQDGPPSADAIEQVAAVVTMFTYDVADPDAYFSWLADAADTVPRFLILGQFGGPATSANRQRINAVLNRMGLELTSEFVSSMVSPQVVQLDPTIVGFESEVDPLTPEHVVVSRVHDAAQIALEYRSEVLGRTVRSVAVATGPGGGYAAGSFFIAFDPALEIKRWIIDPFEFFDRALGAQLFPVPDTTTVSGRRLYFSHVDGDGWNSLTRIERYSSPPARSAEVMLKELVEPYPDLPISIGLVLSDIDPELGGGAAAADIARQLYRLPQVEVASHTNTHPFTWGFFERYDRAVEVSLIERSQAAAPRSLAQRLASAIGLPTLVSSGQHQPVAGGNHLPRAFLRDPFDIKLEVDEALQRTQALAPAGKQAALYLWSGDTRPPEAIVRATREAGVRNMNGGDARFDAQKPSIGYVAPLSRTVGTERQIYAAATNENNYTKLWTDHFHGFRALRETLNRTGEPRRLKGVNVYYHTYSAEHAASLAAVKFHLDWARSAQLAPIRASHYAAIADGFFSTEITRIGDRRWGVANRDGLNTVRFDRADHLKADIVNSQGVLGSAWHGGSLYVALDATISNAVVALQERNVSSAGRDLTTASLGESRWLVRNLARSPCELLFEAEGFGEGEFSWSDLGSHPLTVSAWRGGEMLTALDLDPDETGGVEFSLAVDAVAPVVVRIACRERPAP